MESGIKWKVLNPHSFFIKCISMNFLKTLCTHGFQGALFALKQTNPTFHKLSEVHTYT